MRSTADIVLILTTISGIILAIIASLTSAIISIKTKKVQSEVIVPKLKEIHEITNSNYAKLEAKYGMVIDELTRLRETNLSKVTSDKEKDESDLKIEIDKRGERRSK